MQAHWKPRLRKSRRASLRTHWLESLVCLVKLECLVMTGTLELLERLAIRGKMETPERLKGKVPQERWSEDWAMELVSLAGCFCH